jgi:hypothetical protein
VVPVAAEISATASRQVSSRGPVSSSVRPTYRSPDVSTAVTTSAMSRTSTNGSRTSPAGKTSSPWAIPSTSGPSLKFCANHEARTTVQCAPDDFSASSVGSAWSSPRADSSTSRRTPSPTASRASAPMPSAAAGEPTSDGYIRYAASASRRVSAQVVGSSQSKPRARDAARTVSPASRAA